METTMTRSKLFCGYCHKELSGYIIKEGWIFPEDHFDVNGFYCIANHALLVCGSCHKNYVVESIKDIKKCFFCGAKNNFNDPVA
jgi:uncharacterized CHY-type Zn-finger protein